MTKYNLRAEISCTSSTSSNPHCPFCGSQMGKFRGEVHCPRCLGEVRSSTYNLSNSPMERQLVSSNRLPSYDTSRQSFLSFLKTLRAFSPPLD